MLQVIPIGCLTIQHHTIGTIMSTMTSKSLRFLDYNNDDEARVVDEWLKNERHRSTIRRDNEMKYSASPAQ